VKRRETKSQPDINGQYEGPFTRWFCHEEMATAHSEGLRCIGVMETDARHGLADFSLEKSRAWTGGNGGGPVHERFVEQNLRLLDEVCFIPLRRQEHEEQAMLAEIARQAQVAKRLVPSDIEPEPEPELNPAPDDGFGVETETEPQGQTLRHTLTSKPEPTADASPVPEGVPPLVVGSGAGAWSEMQLVAWLRDMKLDAVADAAAAEEGVDGAMALEMDKEAWKELGASALKAAKIVSSLKRLA
jgi:hypothetical protein